MAILSTNGSDLESIRRYLTGCRRSAAYIGIPCTVDDHASVIRILRRVGAALWLDLSDEKQTPGTCSVCGCTETDACPPGCGWANVNQTLCTTCVGP